MIKFKVLFVLILTHFVFLYGFTQDRKETSYMKFTFKVYANNISDQCKKLQDELKSKQGIFLIVISEKEESFVVVDVSITYKNLSDVAQNADCKLEKLSESVISKSDFEKLKNSVNIKSE